MSNNNCGCFFLYKCKTKFATCLQTLWCGYRVRQAICDERIHAARRRCSKAAQEATEAQCIGTRTALALSQLLNYRQLSHVIEAVANLSAAARLSPACCQRMVADGAITVLYRLLRGCNRSLPHLEVVQHTVNILLSLAKVGGRVVNSSDLKGALQIYIFM